MTRLQKKYSISTHQQKAIAAILASRTLSEAAKSAQVSERTLYRWLDDQAFQMELHKQESRTINEASRFFLSLTEEALHVVHEIITNTELSPSIRLRAAENIFNHFLRIREIASLEERVIALEESLSDHENRR